MSNILRSACLALGLVIAVPAFAQEQAADEQANNPLANATSLNFQNQYFGELTGLDEDANQFYLRFAKPFEAFGGNWIFRATLPINTAPVGLNFAHKTAIGDLNLFAAYLIDTGNPGVSFDIGPQLTLPTATKDELGSEKWSAGFANVLFNGTNPKYQWGYLLTWQTSFAGDDDRDDVNVAALQPFLFYQLGQGWYLRSASVWTFNLENGNYAIPVSLGAGRVIKTEKAVVNMFVEPQYYVAHEGDGQPKWGVFGGINFQF